MEVGVHLRFVLFLLGFFLVPCVFAQTWDDPPFLNVAPRPEIRYEEFGDDRQIVYMEEEIEDEVVLALLNYQGTTTPVLTVTSDNALFLGAIIRKGDIFEGKQFYIIIQKKQDYETLVLPQYILSVTVGNREVKLFLNIVNIDDNKPTIEGSTCQVPEIYLGETNCTYLVSDVDGDISIDAMKFHIESRTGKEETIFKINEYRDDPDKYTMTITLETVEELDYAVSQIHTFTITATDSGDNQGSINAVVQVIDVPNQPPIWKSIFPSQNFDEKTFQQFTVQAIDGDTGIDKQILYRLVDVKYPFFSIGAESGVLNVDAIDRDELNEQVFQFGISAYKYDNMSWETTSYVTIIINDVNDQVPEVLTEKFEATILEETFLTLEFDASIIIHDRDVGENAQYTVDLLGINPPDAADAFLIIPSDGYQSQVFKIIITDSSRLDYENSTWINTQLQIIAIEGKNTSHTGSAMVYINLLNWNDESPIFDEDVYEVEFLETERKGYVVATVHATDLDVGDKVIHSLMGNVVRYLSIDPETGVITVTVDDAFDYNRQSEIIVQVKAVDTLTTDSHKETHTVYAQLIIKLIDVNNKQPEIRMPSSTTSVEENSAVGFSITEEIKGSDADETAEIVFSIDWEKSTASKPGKTVSREEFENCVDIITVYPDESKKGEANGRLVVKEIRDGVTIDFEEFEVLYLVIVVTDKNQFIGPGSAQGTLSLIIIDLNDNKPIWVPGSLATRRIVRELSKSDIFIGSVLATDIDGPLYNNVRYYLTEAEDETITPAGLVAIDWATGQLTVAADEAITCDHPDPRDKLFYLLTATDCSTLEVQTDENCFRVPGNIEIEIIDVNNKFPIPSDGDFDSYVEIDEGSDTGTFITKIEATDLDRDTPYQTIAYSINFEGQQEVLRFFTINSNTGSLTVQLTGEQLDRDEGTSLFNIYITLADNPTQEGDGQRNTNVTMVTVKLLDVNDNAPELPAGLSWTVSENLKKGVTLLPEVIAPDKDEEDTDNSRVQYAILSFSAASTNQNPANYPSDLFEILSPDNKTGILRTNYDLKLYWGTYNIELMAFDLGIPSMNTTRIYELVIDPYNYEAPKFVFPEENQLYRLKIEDVGPGTTLMLANGLKIKEIEAEDPDGLEAGMVTFEVTGKESALQYFTIDNQENNNKQGRLTLKTTLDENNVNFEVTIRAKDKGTVPQSYEKDITFKILFVPTQGSPYFDTNDATVKFTELTAGLTEKISLYEAKDPKNLECTDDCVFSTYYFILPDASADLFVLESTTNILSLARELNREDAQRYVIRIAATNNPTGADSVPSERSILTVEILVKEANPKPRFVQSLYAGGITITDVVGKLLFTLQATHTENLAIKYSIVENSMIADPSLNNVLTQPFLLDENTGEMTLFFKPLVSMSGMFEFQVLATDTDSKTDTADVKVFLIADNNRISFIFDNEEKVVQGERQYISDTFSSVFGYLCNIDYILIASSNDGQVDVDLTEVKTHFIENDVAMEADRISTLMTVTLMRTLRRELETKSLYLQDYSTERTDNVTDDFQKMIKIVLIVLCAVLGVMCIVLMVAFCIKTKSLNRRLNALSTTKFGSQDSGLNRVNVAVPGTNKHALEGSNPVWNEEIKAPDFDSLSNISGDSDLIGVEDNPQFAYESDDKRNTIFQKKKNGHATRRPTAGNVGSMEP